MADSRFVLILILWVIPAVFQLPTHVKGNSLDNVEPNSKSYFDELARLSNYTFQVRDTIDEVDNDKSDLHIPSSLSDFHYYFQKTLDTLSVFQRKPLASSKSDLNMAKFLALLETIDTIKHENREELPPSLCINDTAILIKSLLSGESWAFQFLDAIGKPGPSITKGWLNFVGSYDQCKAATTNKTEDGNQFSGGYFTLPISIHGSPLPAKIGICFPNTCNSNQITSLFKKLFSFANITSMQVGEVIESNVELKVTTATVAAILILLAVGSLAIVGTVYDVFFVQRVGFPTANHFEVNTKSSESNGSSYGSVTNVSEEPNHDTETRLLLPKTTVVDAGPSIGWKVLLAFSLYTNGKKLLNTSQAKGSLGSIHGIRFLSMSWVVLGHCYAFGSMNSSINAATELPILLHRWTFDAISNALVSVDTFFTLSGLLTSYITLQVLWSEGRKMSWPKFYFHRFWRLTPPYMFAIVIFLGFQQYLGHGPFWTTKQPADKEFCEKNWWTNLVYINNLVNTKEICFGHSWYLANDMQFFVISPIMLIPFYFHWIAGVTSCICVLLISWITTGVLSYQNDWGVSVLSLLTSKHQFTWFDHYYIVPWCRIGPYVIGILTGYILAKFKGQPFRIKRWVVVMGWVVAIASALAVLYGVHGDLTGEHPSSRSTEAFYNTVGRSVWGACVCWVIVACSAGYGGPVNALLSWSPFVVLGRLTYMTYLIHLNILMVFFTGMGSLYYLNDTTLPIMFMGLLVFCNMVAFIGVLLLESPMIGLEKVFLKKERKD